MEYFEKLVQLPEIKIKSLVALIDHFTSCLLSGLAFEWQ